MGSITTDVSKLRVCAARKFFLVIVAFLIAELDEGLRVVHSEEVWELGIGLPQFFIKFFVWWLNENHSHLGFELGHWVRLYEQKCVMPLTLKTDSSFVK